MSPLILVGGLGALALLVVASGSKPGSAQPKPSTDSKDLTKEQLQAKLDAVIKRNNEFGSSSGSVRSTSSPCDKPADAAAAKRCEDIALIRGKCDMRLLALPDADFMNVVSVVRTAKDGASLRAVADTLRDAGFRDAASCLRDRADQFDTDLKSIAGLHTTTECDRRLLSLPASIFADVVEASKSTDKNLLKLLSKALRDDGFDAAARCLDDRILALKAPPVEGPAEGSPFDLAPKTMTAHPLSGIALSSSVAPSTAALFDDAVKGIASEGVRAEAKKYLMNLHALDAKGGPADGLTDDQLLVSGYTVQRLLNFAYSIAAEAPAAFAAIKHAADRLNIAKNWTEFVGTSWEKDALEPLSGFNVVDGTWTYHHAAKKGILGSATGDESYDKDFTYYIIESATGHELTSADRDAVMVFQENLKKAGEASIKVAKWLDAYDGNPVLPGGSPARYAKNVDF